MNQPAPQNVSRRRFLESSAAGAAGATIASSITAPATARDSAPSDRLRVGFIGPGRRGFGAHVKSLATLRKRGAKIELAGVNDVYTVHRDRAVDYIRDQTGQPPKTYDDYRDMLADDSIDAVAIGTPDHWHAKQTIDALRAGKHVYCEKPMTHTVDEAKQVIDEWKASGRVLQVGVQSTSSPVWDMAREMIDAGRLGKIVQFQTEYFRNSAAGMSRHNKITPEMTPKNIDWRQWLGADEGLAPEMVFDRAVYGQWRCYWPFGSGMYTDLFVHRVTGMLKATGLRYPGRVVAGGGIFLEYDDREVPDVASLIADFHEGVQGMVSSTMVSEVSKFDHVIRGHHGSLVFEKPCYGGGPKGAFEFLPERPQVTGNSKSKRERFEASSGDSYNIAHFDNFLEAIAQDDPNRVHNDPVLGAAAVMVVNLAVRSYREGSVFQIDRNGKISGGDPSWAKRWESMSDRGTDPHHVPGWHAGDTGSKLVPFDYQRLAGPWTDGTDPAGDP